MFYLKQIKIKKEMEYILVFCLFSLKCQCSLGTKFVMSGYFLYFWLF